MSPGNYFANEGPEYRTFPDDKLEELRNDEEFRYERREYAMLPFWDRLTSAISRFIKQLFGAMPSGWLIQGFFIVLAALVLIYVVIRVVGMDLNAFFKIRKEVTPQTYTLSEENIERIDFDKEISDARNTGKWRVLIRLQYLYTLKQLSLKGLIELNKSKTNHDYLYEIKAPAVQKYFSEISRLFDYTWYGHFEVTPGVVREADLLMDKIQTNLRA